MVAFFCFKIAALIVNSKNVLVIPWLPRAGLVLRILRVHVPRALHCKATLHRREPQAARICSQLAARSVERRVASDCARRVRGRRRRRVPRVSKCFIGLLGQACVDSPQHARLSRVARLGGLALRQRAVLSVL